MVNSLSSRSHYTLTFTQIHGHHRRRCMSTHRLLYVAVFTLLIFLLFSFHSYCSICVGCFYFSLSFCSFHLSTSFRSLNVLVFIFLHLHAINTYKRSHWINFCIGSDQILRGAFQLNSNRLHTHNKNLFMYIICPFFSLSFLHSILSARPDQCGAKRALADKKRVSL